MRNDAHIAAPGIETMKKGFPALMLEVVAMAEDPSTSVNRLGHVISTDEALSARVLKIANSSALGVQRRVSDVGHAITLLGFETLRDTMLKIMVSNAFHKMFSVFGRYEEFWNHSISCAYVAQHLAKKTGLCPPDRAFIAGLFHDLGILLADEEAGKDFPAAAAAKQHEEFGGWLAAEWQLGLPVVDAIEHHHHPAGATVDPPLVAVVHVADVLCTKLGFGTLADDPATSCDPQALAVLGLTADDLDATHLAGEIAEWKADCDSAPTFGALVGQMRKVFLEAVSALPERERSCLALFFHEGLSFADIARVLRLTEAQARRLHESGLASLVKTVQEHI